MRPTMKPRSIQERANQLGKRDILSLSTPDLLGIRKETSPANRTPFNLKELLGENDESGDSEEDPMKNEGEGFKPLRFPSPSPSKLKLIMLGLLDSPLMTWGDIETEPIKLGPISFREAVV